MRKLLSARLALAGVLAAASAFGQTTSVTKTFTTSGGIRFGAGVTTVSVSMWGGGGGGSAGGMTENPGNTPRFHTGAGGGGSNWAGGSMAVTPNVFYPITVGAGGAAGGLDGNGNPMSGGNGTESTFGSFRSFGGYGGTIVGFNAIGGAHAANSVPDPGPPYAGDGQNDLINYGGNGGRANDGPYGPSAPLTFDNYSSGDGYPAGFGYSSGVPGLRPGDGGGGGGYTVIPHFPIIDQRIPGGKGGDGIVNLYITYPTYRITQPLVASRLCGPGRPTITLRSSALSSGQYTVTYNTSNPTTTGNTAFMSYDAAAGFGAFATIALSNTSTITITNLSSGNTCSDAITQNNTVVVEVENQVPNDWDAFPDFGGNARSGAVSFTIGNKAYVGTGKSGSTLQRDFWQFDGATNTWTQLADFGGGLRTDAVGFGLGTKGYIGTGSDGSNSKNDFWEYDPFTNVWTARAAFSGQPRQAGVAFTIAGKGYIGLGANGATHYIDVAEYDPNNNTWTGKAVFANNVAGAGRTKAIAFSIGNKAFVGLGLNNLGSYTSDLWQFDPLANTWVQKASYPGAARSGAVGFAIGSKGYVGTGWNGSTYYNDINVYDPSNNGWLSVQSFPGTARANAIAFVLGSKAYVGLGMNATASFKDLFQFTSNTGVITTGALSASSFCTGTSITVPFSVPCAGVFNLENEFVVQLSDANGSFSNPVAIGSAFTGNGLIPSSVTATIPANAAAGSRYRLRVVGTAPETIGTDNGINFAIKTSVTTPVAATIDRTSICRGEAINLGATVGTAATSDTTILLSENFNSGAPSWLITLNNSYPADAGITGIIADGEHAAHSNDNSPFYGTISSGRFANDVTNTTLQSPAISTLGVTSATLTFYHHYQYGNYNNSDSIRIQASTDNGATWTTVYLNNSTTVGDPQDSLGFVKQMVSLNNFVNQPFLVLRFNYGALGGLGRWYIDNIVLKAVSQSNNYRWSSSPAGFSSTVQNPANVVPTAVPGTTTYTVAYSNSYGCGTVSNSVSVFVKDTSSSTTTISICPSALPFQWNGLTFTAAGTKVAHLVNAAGCDSAAKLTLVVKPVSTSTTNISICPTALPYSWNGLTFTGSGTQTAHFTNSVGCDSAATLHLTVKAVSTFTQNTTICESALPYTWNGVTLNAAGSTTVHFTNAVGCDSAVTLNLATTPSVTSATASATSVCAGAVVSLGAAASSGATVTVLNEGFNSTHNDWTKINAGSGGLVDSAAWMLRPYNYEVANGVVGLTSNDNSQFYLTNSSAQGSGVTTNTILQSPAFSTMGLTTATLNFYQQFTHQNNFANDSIRVQVSEDGSNWTNLYVNKSTTVGYNTQFAQQTISLAGYLNKPALRLRFVYNGSPLPGGYTNYWWAIDNVTVSGTIAGSTFSWSSVPAGFTSTLQNPAPFTPTQTATYTVAVNNGYCAATRSVTVRMNTTNPSSTTNLAICPSSLPYSWNGLTFTGAGTQTAHIATAGNCDSLATLVLTVRPQGSSVTNLTICPSGLPFTWNGVTFTAAGTKTALIPTGAVCDSAATLHLTVQNSSTSSTTTLTICDDQLPYTWNGQVFTAAGSKTATLSNSYGCDSVATLYLFVANRPSAVTAAATVTSLCPGGSTSLSASAALTTGSILDENFNGGATGWTTQNASTAGTPANAAWTLRADGYVYPELFLTFHSNDNTSFFLSNSRAQGIGSSTDTYLQSPVFSTMGYSAATLTFYHHYIANNNDSIRIQISTDYGATWARLYGRNTALQGSSSNFQLQTISLNGYVNQPGLRLRFNYGATYDYYWALDNVKITGTASPLTYSWTSTPAGFTSTQQNPAGLLPTTTTNYTVDAVSATGCRNTATVTVNVKATSSSTTNLVLCPTALPFSWNGLTFAAAGSQTAHLVNSAGCDSAATLVLSVKSPTTSTTTTSVCPGAFPYTWNGLLFTGAGSQTVHLTNAAGCDSAATYTVTVKAVSSSTQSVAVCAGQLPYSWNGLTFTAAGTQTAHLLNSVGCDSAATLTLTVTASPANLVVSASATSLCQGSAVNLGATALSGTSSLILSEGFNSATNNWTRTNTSTGGNTAAAAWTLTASSGSLQSNDNSQFYFSNSDAQGGGTTHTTLVSPPFSTVGYSAPTLSFYQMYRHYDGSDIKVQVSTDGVNWTTLYQNNSSNVGDVTQFVLQTIPLDAYVNQPNLRVRFNFNATWGYYWAVDNVTVSAPAPNTYSWTSSPAGFTSAQQNPSGLMPALNTVYTVTATNALGCSSTGSVQVAVSPAPSATIQYGLNNCAGGGTASLLQTGTPGGVYSAQSGLALNAGTGAVNLAASTPGTYTVTYTLPAAGSCGAFATTTSLTIDPTYQVVATASGDGSISNAGSTTLCAGNSLTYQFTPSACAQVEEVLVDGASVGAVTSYTFNDLAANHSISVRFVSTLSAAPVLLNASAVTVCPGTNVVLTQTGGSLGAGAHWQWYTDAAFTQPAGGMLTSTNAQLTVAPGVATSYYLRAEGGTAPCAANVAAGTSISIALYPAAAGGTLSPAAQVVAYGATPTALVLSGASGTVLRWQRADDAAFTQNVQDISNTASTYAPGALTAGGWYRALVLGAGGCGQQYSAAASIQVSSAPALYTLSATGATAYCNGQGVGLQLSGSQAGVQYQLLRNGLNSGAGLAGTGNALDFGVQPAGTYTVQAYFVSDNTVAMNGTVVLSDLGTFSAQLSADNTQLCDGGGGTTIHVTGGPANGQVSVATNGGGIQLIALDPTGAASFSTGTLTTSTTYTLTGVSNGTCITTVNASLTVYVNQANPDPLPNQVFCAGMETPGILFSGNFGPGATYTWTNSNPAIGLAASGSGDRLPSFVAANTGSAPLYAYIRVTPVPTVATGCKLGSMIFRIQVNPAPTMSGVGSQSLCAGATTAPVVFSSPDAGATFVWNNLNTAIGAPAQGVGNVPAFVAQNNTASASLTAQFMVYPVLNGCQGATQTFEITVRRAANALHYPQAAYCGLGSANAQLSGTTGGTFTATPAGLQLDGATGMVTLGQSAPGTYTVTYTAPASGNACAGTVSTQLTVLPGATVNAIGNPVYCNGATTAAIPLTGNATLYSWTVSGAIGLSAGVGTAIPSFTATNPGTGAVSAMVTVTPLGNGSSSCTGRPMAFRITVNPTPSVNAVGNQVYCRGNSAAPITFSGPVARTAYNWTSSSTVTGLLLTRGSNSIPTFLTTNTISGTVSSTIVVTPVADKCSGAPISFQYQVGNCVTATGNTDGSNSNLRRSTLVLEVTLAPNPTQDRVTVRVAGKEGSYGLVLTDQYGQSLRAPVYFSGNQYTLSLAGLPAGTYLLTLTDRQGGAQAQRKVVKL